MPKRIQDNLIDLSHDPTINLISTALEVSGHHLSHSEISETEIEDYLKKGDMIKEIGKTILTDHRPLPHPPKYDGQSGGGIYKIHNMENDPVKIALIGDWGTDTKESQEIAKLASNNMSGQPHYTIHLGDTYFVGSEEQIERNFNPSRNHWCYGKFGISHYWEIMKCFQGEKVIIMFYWKMDGIKG